MKKVIYFAGYCATLNCGEGRAMLTVNTAIDSDITRLADTIEEAGSLSVNEIFTNDNGESSIRMTTDLGIRTGDLLDIVSEAISTVYNSDVTVTNARTETVV